MAIDGFSVACHIVVQVRCRSGGVDVQHKVVNARSAAEVPTEGFELTPFSNLLSKFVNSKIVWKVAMAITPIIIDFSLSALDRDYQGFHDTGEIACCDPF